MCPFTVVVEPQELSQYTQVIRNLGGTVAALPLNDQGVSYARNHILTELSPENGWFWIMDDDIQRFQRSANGLVIPVSASQMLTIGSPAVAEEHNACLYSLEYEQFGSYCFPGQIIYNSYNNIAVCMNRARFPSQDIRYRFKVREDYDLVLQIVRGGGTTIRRRDLCFRVPSMGKASGGMTDYYTRQRRDIRLQNKLFLDAWGGIAEELMKGSGPTLHHDIRVAWRKLSDPSTASAYLREHCSGVPSKDPLTAQAGPDQKADLPRRAASPISKKRAASAPSVKSTPVKSEATTEVIVKAPRPPRVTAPRMPPNWKGWEKVIGRDISPQHADDVGLKILRDAPKLGDDVAVVPWSLDIHPSVIAGTVVSVFSSTGTFEVVPRREYVGVPSLIVSKCYSVPTNLERCQRAVDQLFIHVTSTPM